MGQKVDTSKPGRSGLDPTCYSKDEGQKKPILPSEKNNKPVNSANPANISNDKLANSFGIEQKTSKRYLISVTEQDLVQQCRKFQVEGKLLKDGFRNAFQIFNQFKLDGIGNIYLIDKLFDVFLQNSETSLSEDMFIMRMKHLMDSDKMKLYCTDYITKSHTCR